MDTCIVVSNWRVSGCRREAFSAKEAVAFDFASGRAYRPRRSDRRGDRGSMDDPGQHLRSCLGWTMGLEPTTAGVTIRSSTN